jgi:hypothetical protein
LQSVDGTKENQMIKINLIPVFFAPKTEIKTIGTLLTLNGVDYELSDLPDGAEACHPVLGRVTRMGNDYEMTVILGHGNPAPESVRFPTPLEITSDFTFEYEYGEVANVVAE